jgi:hypothetical protein
MASRKSTSRAHVLQQSLRAAFRRRERIREQRCGAAKMPPGRKMFYSKSDAAAILSISARSLDYMIAIGQLEGFRAKAEGGGWHFLIHPNSIVRAIGRELRSLPDDGNEAADVERLGRALEFLTAR